MLRAGLVGPEQRLQGDDDYVCVSLPKKRMFGSDRRIAKIRFRDLSTKRSKNTRRVGPQRLDCCAKPSGHAPSPSFWGWVRHAHSVRMTVPGPNFISHMPGTDPSMVRLQEVPPSLPPARLSWGGTNFFIPMHAHSYACRCQCDL